jgi:hypothetical protein
MADRSVPGRSTEVLKGRGVQGLPRLVVNARSRYADRGQLGALVRCSYCGLVQPARRVGRMAWRAVEETHGASVGHHHA